LTNKKSFTAPVWWMIFLILLVLWYSYQVVIAGKGLLIGSRRFKFLVIAGIFVSILLGEAIAYWCIRKRPVQKKLVWLHIISLLLAIVIVPVLYATFIYFWPELLPQESYEQWRAYLFNLKNILSLFFLVMGHGCFVTMLVKVFAQRRKEPIIVQDTGILDDYADKFD